MSRPLALVTGASRSAGIGAAIAAALAGDGWDVATTFWRPYDASMPWHSDADDVTRLRARLEELGARTLAIEADLASLDAPTRIFDAVSRASTSTSRSTPVRPGC